MGWAPAWETTTLVGAPINAVPIRRDVDGDVPENPNFQHESGSIRPPPVSKRASANPPR